MAENLLTWPNSRRYVIESHAALIKVTFNTSFYSNSIKPPFIIKVKVRMITKISRKVINVQFTLKLVYRHLRNIKVVCGDICNLVFLSWSWSWSKMIKILMYRIAENLLEVEFLMSRLRPFSSQFYLMCFSNTESLYVVSPYLALSANVVISISNPVYLPLCNLLELAITRIYKFSESKNWKSKFK